LISDSPFETEENFEVYPHTGWTMAGASTEAHRRRLRVVSADHRFCLMVAATDRMRSRWAHTQGSLKPGTDKEPIRCTSKGGLMAIQTKLHQRRIENLKAMNSPASYGLAGAVVVAMLCATFFYDRPLANNNQLFSYLRSFSTPDGG
jgi:hypothetical protein